MNKSYSESVNEEKNCVWVHKQICRLEGRCSICPHAKAFINIMKNSVVFDQTKYIVKRINDYIEVHRKNGNN